MARLGGALVHGSRPDAEGSESPACEVVARLEPLPPCSGKESLAPRGGEERLAGDWSHGGEDRVTRRGWRRSDGIVGLRSKGSRDDVGSRRGRMVWCEGAVGGKKREEQIVIFV
jgi:hypothetical protein